MRLLADVSLEWGVCGGVAIRCVEGSCCLRGVLPGTSIAREVEARMAYVTFSVRL